MNMISHQHELGREIFRLESMSKQGASYSDATGRYGWRNPIRQDTGPLLSSMVASYDPCCILEIGTAHGLSALHLAQGWGDLSSREMHTLELDEAVGKEAQERFDVLGLPITVHIGEAMDSLNSLKDKVFDLVFLDAQKSHYGRQWRFLMEVGMVSKGTVLLADNVIDRKLECTELFNTLTDQGISYRILPTECGLLSAIVP